MKKEGGRDVDSQVFLPFEGGIPPFAFKEENN